MKLMVNIGPDRPCASEGFMFFFDFWQWMNGLLLELAKERRRFGLWLGLNKEIGEVVVDRNHHLSNQSIVRMIDIFAVVCVCVFARFSAEIDASRHIC